MSGTHFIMKTSKFLLISTTVVTLSQGPRKVIQHISRDLYFLYPKFQHQWFWLQKQKSGLQKQTENRKTRSRNNWKWTDACIILSIYHLILHTTLYYIPHCYITFTTFKSLLDYKKSMIVIHQLIWTHHPAINTASSCNTNHTIKWSPIKSEYGQKRNSISHPKCLSHQCSTSTFHGTCLNAHFEEIRSSNTHNSFMITEFLPVWSMILSIWKE